MEKGIGNLSRRKGRILQRFQSSISKASSASWLTAFLCQAGKKRALLNHPEVNEGHCHPVTRWLITASADRAASKQVGIIHDAYAAMDLKGNLHSRCSEHGLRRGRGGLAPVNRHLPSSSCKTNKAPSEENKRKLPSASIPSLPTQLFPKYFFSMGTSEVIGAGNSWKKHNGNLIVSLDSKRSGFGKTFKYHNSWEFWFYAVLLYFP